MLPVYSGEVEIPAGEVVLKGILRIPKNASGAVLFAHGSGSGRLSPRNQFVANKLYQANFATLLFDLLTEAEEREDDRTARLRFNIPFLAQRLVSATDWFCERTVHSLPIGYFGASTGAAAALVASTERPEVIQAVVSRGGRPDLAGENILTGVKASTLLIVGGNDPEVLDLNRRSLALVPAQQKQLVIVPHAGHLFEEPGALAEVANHATKWFIAYLKSAMTPGRDMPRSRQSPTFLKTGRKNR